MDMDISLSPPCPLPLDAPVRGVIWVEPEKYNVVSYHRTNFVFQGLVLADL